MSIAKRRRLRGTRGQQCQGDCADCGLPGAVISTFTGLKVCVACQRRRIEMASLLGAIVRWATPEEVRVLAPLAPEVTLWADDPEHREMLDHVDLLLAVHSTSQEI